jgi:hypothetical protein
MAVGFWNFLGAGVFGFLINMPIVSYFEVGISERASRLRGLFACQLRPGRYEEGRWRLV